MTKFGKKVFSSYNFCQFVDLASRRNWVKCLKSLRDSSPNGMARYLQNIKLVSCFRNWHRNSTKDDVGCLNS